MTDWALEWRAGKAWEWFSRYNRSAPGYRAQILKEHLGDVGEDCCIRAPFYCEIGENIHLGNSVFINYCCTFLDVARIEIGDKTMLGPGVQIYTAYHDKDHGTTEAKAVFIGSNVWIGGAAIILPGIQIGDGSTIGAGSVVTKHVPIGATVKGNPAK